MVLVSLVTLVPNYRYPKQDFAGALDFLDAHRNAGDPVATVGVTRHVYRTYYGRPWLVLASGADLEAALAAGRRVWVVYTLAGYIRVAQPEIMQALVDRCAVDAVFPGTLNDGEVTVCHVDPANR
jgi:hypothetical protein